MKAPPQQRIAGFDGLRALAVIAVFFSHTAPTWAGLSGFLGVTLFFALSGFLIVSILYQERLAIEAKRRSLATAWKAFLVRRTFRIFPIYYLTLAVMALLAFLNISRIDWDPVGHIFHIFYLSNIWITFVQHKLIGQYSHLWSLSIEEQFYLVAAPLLLFFPARMHIVVCSIVVGMGLVAEVLSIGGTTMSIGIYYSTTFEPIALGGVAGLACKQGNWRLGGDTLLALAISGFVMIWATCFIAHGWLAAALDTSIPVFAALIVILTFSSQVGHIVRILEWKPLAHLGRISYGFYLYHNFIRLQLFETPNLSHRVITHLLEFVVVFTIAELSWYFIERPLMSFARARTGIRSMPTIVTAAEPLMKEAV